MYGALPSRPRLGLAPLPNSPISKLDDGLIVAIFSFLKPNHLRFTGTEFEHDDAPMGYRCSSDCRKSELVNYVSIVELIRCSMVCRQWHRCAQLRALWEEADLSRFSRAVNDDLVLRLAQKAGRRLKSICLNHCANLTDASMYHLATHCPLITEVHFQAIPNLSAAAVLHLIRTLAYRNGLRRTPATLSIEMAHCAFLTPRAVDEIEKSLRSAARTAAAEGKYRRALLRAREHSSHRDAGAGAPAAGVGSRTFSPDENDVVDDNRWYELDVALCSVCSGVVSIESGGKCSICSAVTCDKCSEGPTACEKCCESFCAECRLVATCVECMQDFCEECQDVLMCADCDAVLCPGCKSSHECEPQHSQAPVEAPAAASAAPPAPAPAPAEPTHMFKRLQHRKTPAYSTGLSHTLRPPMEHPVRSHMLATGQSD